MKKIIRILCALTIVCSVSQAALAEKYNVDPAHSALSFSVDHLGLTSIDGRFTDFTGVINWDDEAADLSNIEFTAQAQSVNTDVAKRDEHLRSADFFEVEKYPTLTFRSTKIKSLGSARYQVEGDLTIHGVTKPISTIAYLIGPKEAMGQNKIGFRTTFDINRIDYKVGDGDKFKGDTMIGHKISIEVKGEAAQAK